MSKIKKKGSESIRVTVSLSEELYVVLKRYAKADLRSIPQEARFFIETAIEMVQQAEMSHDAEDTEEEEDGELTPAIGFQVDKSEDTGTDEDEEEEEEDKAMEPKKRPSRKRK